MTIADATPLDPDSKQRGARAMRSHQHERWRVQVPPGQRLQVAAELLEVAS